MEITMEEGEVKIIRVKRSVGGEPRTIGQGCYIVDGHLFDLGPVALFFEPEDLKLWDELKEKEQRANLWWSLLPIKIMGVVALVLCAGLVALLFSPTFQNFLLQIGVEKLSRFFLVCSCFGTIGYVVLSHLLIKPKRRKVESKFDKERLRLVEKYDGMIHVMQWDKVTDVVGSMKDPDWRTKTYVILGKNWERDVPIYETRG
jgi:hypothetical protein